jgi:ABC-type antimicrobial peptide transport system permease subunit
MLRTSIKITLRSLWKNKTYSFINIFGLAVSLAASILILLWVNDELSFDKFHKNGKNIFLINTSIKQENNKVEYWPSSPPPLATFAKREIPEIKDVCRISGYDKTSFLQYKGEKIFDKNFGAADASLFSIFSFPLRKGNITSPLPDDQSVVLSEQLAQKLFGSEDPIGKILKGSDNVAYHVTAVMKNIPDNSTIKYSAIFSFDTFKKDTYGSKQVPLEEAWGQYFSSTYLLLNDNANIKAIADKITDIHHDNQEWAKSSGVSHTLQQITQIHLYDADGKEAGMQNVRSFFIIAIVIMVIASINYVNLTTARSASRVKEIGIKKIIGANKFSLFIQFICESIILFLLSLVVATVVIYLLIPYYNNLSGKNLVFNPLSGSVISVYLLAFITVVILAGIYPAFILSSIKPSHTTQSWGSGQIRQYLRKTLVTIQFVSSIAFIVGAIVMNEQLKYIQTINPGYNKGNTIMFNAINMIDHFDAVKATLLKEPSIKSISSSSEPICNINYLTGDVEWEGKDPNKTFVMSQFYMGKDFITTLDVNIISGNGFFDTPADSTSCLLNETAVNKMGLRDPVGKTISFLGRKTIVGVVKDFHFQNMHEKIAPLIVLKDQHWSNSVIYVKTTTQSSLNAIAAIEKEWGQYNSDHPFEYKFLDELFEKTHRTDLRTGLLFNCFAIVTIILCCMGLFGLVTHTTEARVKEIGIRKTLGASATNIVKMLSINFMKLVCIAMLISFPMAWLIINKILQNFAYHIHPGWFIFFATGVIVLVITAVTVSFQAIRAAIANPVKSLRSE